MRSLIEDDPEAIEIGPNAISLDLLQAVYRSSALPLHTRMRAAISALPHECPRLAVVAQIAENDIATVLDRRVAHYQKLQSEMKLIEAQPTNGKPIEQPEPLPEPKPQPTPAPLNRLYSTKLWRRF
jgi:hypothetical protein